MRQEDRELVAADPEHPVGGSKLPAEDAAHLDEQIVSDGVTGGVVDGLEVVDVDEQHGEVHPVADAEGEQALELLLEGAVVGEPRQGVLERATPGRFVEGAQVVARCDELFGGPDDGAGHPGDEGNRKHERDREASDRGLRRSLEQQREERPETRHAERDEAAADEERDHERGPDDEQEAYAHELELRDPASRGRQRP